jgi:hypothetical protein
MFAGLCAAGTAQSFSLAENKFGMTGTMPEGASLPVLATTGTIAGRFVPFNWLRLTARTSVDIPDMLAFLNTFPGQDIRGSIDFEGASAEIPSFVGTPISLTVFTGYLDDLSSDTLLRTQLKTPIATPEFLDLPISSAFSNEARIYGNGCALAVVPGTSSVAIGLYVYANQNDAQETVVSMEPRVASCGEFYRINAYGGASANFHNSTFSVRGGFTALFTTDSGNEIYMQAGIIPFDPSGGVKPEKNLYLMFEPQLHFGIFDIALSFFASPLLSDAGIIEGNYLGGDVLAGIGNIETGRMRGGISLMGTIDPAQPSMLTPFTFVVTPFYTIKVSDYLLEISAALNPLGMSSLSSAGELRISMKAVY